MMESAVRFSPQNNLVGILGQPSEGVNAIDYPAIVFLNAGMIHRIGPHRLYVHACRRLNDLGFVTLRLDLSGIGDSIRFSTDDSFAKSATRDVIRCLDFLHGYNTRSYVLIGLCSGGDVAVATALADSRVVGVVSINAYNLDRNLILNRIPGIKSRTQVRLNKKRLLSKPLSDSLNFSPTKLFRKGMKLLKHLTTNQQSLPPPEIETQWRKLVSNDVKVLLIFSEGSDAFDAYSVLTENTIRPYVVDKKITVNIIPETDHTFTPVWSQKRLINDLQEWLQTYTCEIKAINV